MAILLALPETPVLTGDDVERRTAELLGEDRMRQLATAMRAERNYAIARRLEARALRRGLAKPISHSGSTARGAPARRRLHDGLRIALDPVVGGEHTIRVRSLRLASKCATVSHARRP
jgi:hypothetical protein